MNDREPTITVDQLMERLQFAQEQGDRRVMAERERCAKIAEASADRNLARRAEEGLPALESRSVFTVAGVLDICEAHGRNIAAKIREGE
jgi:hypothetical protein